MFYSQLTSKVIHAGLVQAVVYLEHVVPFEYFVSSIVHNNRLYINTIVYHTELCNYINYVWLM